MLLDKHANHGRVGLVMLNCILQPTSKSDERPGRIAPLGAVQHDTGRSSFVEPTMKRCYRCGKVKLLSEFYCLARMADGHFGKCKVCFIQDVKDNYRKRLDQYHAYERERSQDPERREAMYSIARRGRVRHPDRTVARAAVGNAIRDRRLIRQPCEICGSPKAEAHHDDYSKPLDVQWLCWTHHQEHHGHRPTANFDHVKVPF